MERLSRSATKPSNNNSNIQKTKFNVVIRIRPDYVGTEMNSDLFTEDDLDKVIFKTNQKQIKLKKPLCEDRFFNFDHILNDNASQEEAYDCVAKKIVEDVIEGFNGTIMAYGQTGSGKTYTIFGKEKSMEFWNNNNIDAYAGIVPRAIKQLFISLNSEEKRKKYKISVSFFQIYMEQITDLIPDLNNENEEKVTSNVKQSMSFNLNNTKNIKHQAKKDVGEGLKIREDPLTGTFVQDLKQVQVENEEQLLGLIKYSSKNRITTNTNMNQTSSRSHAILRILFEKRTYNEDERGTRKTTSGLLTIVDLAGSEKAKLSTEGIRFEETKFINSSLYHLGSVIKSLANNPKEATFRSSSLTRILQDCISGNSKTSICATVSPFYLNYDETLTTLQFASRAVKISIQASVNERIEVKNFKESIQKLITGNKNGHQNTITNMLLNLNSKLFIIITNIKAIS